LENPAQVVLDFSYRRGLHVRHSDAHRPGCQSQSPVRP
jgi:hypothetical protein